MSTENRSIELEDAFCWTCPDCGQLNFGRQAINRCTLEQKEQFLRKELEVEDWQDLPEGWEDELIAVGPDSVICLKCDASFEVEYPNDNEEDDDE